MQAGSCVQQGHAGMLVRLLQRLLKYVVRDGPACLHSYTLD